MGPCPKSAGPSFDCQAADYKVGARQQPKDNRRLVTKPLRTMQRDGCQNVVGEARLSPTNASATRGIAAATWQSRNAHGDCCSRRATIYRKVRDSGFGLEG